MIIVTNSGKIYKLGRLLGEGGFGLVYEALISENDQHHNLEHQEQ